MSIISPPVVEHSSTFDTWGAPIFKLSLRQYHDMIEAGIITRDDRAELLEGLLVCKMSKNPPHRIATKLLSKALERIVPSGWYVDAQEPFTTETSEPEPDVAVIRGDTRDYMDRHPGASDVAMVVEIADTSLKLDRITKQRIYAAAGVQVYWILNLIDRRLEVFTKPIGATAAAEASYHEQAYFPEDGVVPVVIDGHEIARLTIREILP